MTQSGTGGGAG